MNNLENILHQTIGLFAIIPLLAFLITLFWQNKREKPIAIIVQFTKGFYIVTALTYGILWIVNGSIPVSQKGFTIYKTEHFVFAIQFYYDHITAVYSIVGAVLFFLVATFSRYYMHRDEGYQRFFNTILFFALGYNLIIFSGNFETFFAGWEIIGLASFLLIAFYRNRYLPVKNAYKVISNYRISDVALILTMWMMHHLTNQNISFTQLTEAKKIAEQVSHSSMAVFVEIMIILAATIKSAQLPFTSWLPRAMEGPTSSSAIFYGSLSVHIGVFLLMRTYPFWQDMLWARIAIVTIGALTGIIATFIAGRQPTVKTQIAYSSAAQIGIIFIEVALGFHILALVHFAGNAFLRTYQLLVSPSVLNYLVHHQYFHYQPKQEKRLSRLKATLYILCIKEWNLDAALFTYLWSPFKWLGKRLQVLNSTVALVVATLVGIASFVFAFFWPHHLQTEISRLPVISFLISLLFILFSFAHRQSAIKAWIYLFLGQVFIMAGVGFNAEHIHSIEIFYYATGIATSFVLGFYCLQKIKSIDSDISLNQYHGYVFEKKGIALLFLLSAIGILGFPVTMAFVGIDVFATYVHSNQIAAITLLALCFIFIELAAIRIYCRIFLGLHKKPHHPVAFKSS